MQRAFSLVEIMAVVAIGGVVATAAFTSIVPLFERSRRSEQAAAAVAQIRKMRAHALTANEGAAVEVQPLPAGGVRMTTAVVPRNLGGPQCQSYVARASSIEERDYDLLDIVVPRTDNILCFEATAFRLLAQDGVSLAPAAAPVDFFLADTPQSLGTVTVAVSGTFGSTFEPAVQEGLVLTANVAPDPQPEDPVRNVLPPRTIEPELPVFEAPPPAPTTPAGQPDIAPLPEQTNFVDAGPPVGCVVDGDCALGYFCDAAGDVCVLAAAGCVTAADCSAETVCIAGNCVAGCNMTLCISSGCSTFCSHNECCSAYGCLCY